MRSRAEVTSVLELIRAGWEDVEIARVTGIPRRTIRDWRNGRTPDFDRLRTRPGPRANPCVVCGGDPLRLPQTDYTYLLGLYLGDWCIATHHRGVFRLRIVCADAYPELIQRCQSAMTQVLPNKVCRVKKVGCTEVTAYSKHWPCLFPQHGPGRKHERRIELTVWQQELVDQDPRPLIRGLLHSDGCRVLNWVNGTAYPRYHFCNLSADIRGIFGRACDQLGVAWRPNNRFTLSVARRGSVALLDEFVGPKR